MPKRRKSVLNASKKLQCHREGNTEHLDAGYDGGASDGEETADNFMNTVEVNTVEEEEEEGEELLEQEIPFVSCNGFSLTPVMRKYMLLSPDSLYDPAHPEGNIAIPHEDAIHAPNCGECGRQSAKSKKSIECERLRERVSRCAQRFEEDVNSGILTRRRVDDMHTPGMQRAALEEAIQIRKELDLLKDELGEEWKQQHLAEYNQFLANEPSNPSFLANFIYEQVTQHKVSGAKQRRWSPETISFWLTYRHQYYTRKGLEVIIGTGNYGKTKDNNSNSNFNIHAPSNRTLDLWEPPGYYPVPDTKDIDKIKERAAAYAEKVKSPYFILSFDGVYSNAVYEYDCHNNVVLGGERALSAIEFIHMTEDMLIANHGREIVQFFLQNIEGDYVEPIGHYVIPEKADYPWVIARFKELIGLYSSPNVKIIGSAADGDLFCAEGEVLMSQWNTDSHKLPWFHFYDFSHAVRNARNALQNRELLLPRAKHIISMSHLLELRKKYPILNDTVLPAIAFNPPDKMNMHDCLLLMNIKVIDVLDKIADTAESPEDSSIAESLSNYIRIMRTYYDLMMSPESLDSKVSKFEAILEYLLVWQSEVSGTHALADPTFFAIIHTILSLFKLRDYLFEHGVTCRVKTSVLSTLVVEHHFSIARGILNVFTVKQYSHITMRVWFETLQRKSKAARSFGHPSDNRTRSRTVYGNLNIELDNIPQLVRHPRRTAQQRRYDHKIRLHVQYITAKIHAMKEPAKVRSVLINTKKTLQFKCTECVKLVYSRRVLESHLTTVHRKPSEEAAKIAFDTENNAIQKSLEKPAQYTLDDISEIKNMHYIQVPTLPFKPIEPPKNIPARVIVFIDIETPNAYNFPKGGICSIAVAHELDKFQIIHTLVNPFPHIAPVVAHLPTPHMWDRRLIQLHHITPSDVQFKPNMQTTLQGLLEWASMNFTLPEVIFVAHNCSFDRTRTTRCIEGLLPHINTNRFKWVDTLPLLKPITLLQDPRGKILKKSSKLSVLAGYHFPRLDLSKSHSADFDVYVLMQLLVKEYNADWEIIKGLFITQLETKSIEKTGCGCYHGCTSRQCKCIEVGCTINCSCRNCKNVKGANPNQIPIITDLRLLTIDQVNSFNVKDLKYICQQNHIDVKEKKRDDLLDELLVRLHNIAIDRELDELYDSESDGMSENEESGV